MKKLLYSLAAVATLLFAASCAQENLGGPIGGETVEATFKVALPDAVGTKAISDGEKATYLRFLAYDQNDKFLKDLKPVDSTDGFVEADGTRTFDFKVKLIKGVKYSFVFFAESAKDLYTIAEDGTIISIPDATLKAMMNDDKYDAFIAKVKNYTVTGPFSETIELTRPFAQVNVGAAEGDLTAAKASNIETGATMLTAYTINVPNTLNVIDGTVSGYASVEFTPAPRPDAASTEPTLQVGNEKYDWVAMTYVLRPVVNYYDAATGTLTLTTTAEVKNNLDGDLKLVVNTKQNDTDIPLERTVYNVPVQRNYRTNILGNIFSVEGSFKIIIEEGFQTPDGDLLPEAANITELNGIFADEAKKDVWYKIALNVADGESGTITLPKTTQGIDLKLIGDFADNDITIAYEEGAAENEKPAELKLEVKELNELKANITSTHFELVAGSHVVNAEVATSNTTFVIQKTAKVDNLKINAGGLVIEEGATVENISVDINANVTLPEELAEKVTYFGEIESKVALAKAIAEGGEFTIAADIPDADGLFLAAAEPKNLTIDLGGHTLGLTKAVGSAGTVSQALHLEKGSTVVIKNGTITGSPADGVLMLVQNYADLTLDSVILDFTASNRDYALSNNFGHITITGSTEINVAEGKTAFDLWYGMSSVYDEGVYVTFDENFTGKVNGNIEYGAAGRARNIEGWREKAVLTIKGNGTFNGNIVASSTGALEGASISITGGTFTSDPSAFVADGYIATLNADGKYVVAEGERKTPTFSVTPAELNLFVGGNGELVLTNGSDGELTVASDNTEVATVALVEDKYVVTAVAAGTANITFAVAQSNTFEAAEVKVPVTVAAVEFENIFFSKQPEKVEFAYGEEFSFDGEVKAKYNNGNEIPVDVNELSITGYSATTPGEQEITVSYNSFPITYKVTVAEQVITYTSISELKALMDAGNGAISSPVTLGAVKVTNVYTNKKNAWIEDATGGMVIYDSNGGINLVASKEYTGLVVSATTMYNSDYEITGYSEENATNVSLSELPLTILSASDFNAESYKKYQYMRIGLNGLTLDSAVSSSNRTHTIGGVQVYFPSMDIKTESVVNVIGRMSIYSEVYQISVSSSNDVTIVTEGIETTKINGLVNKSIKQGESFDFSTVVSSNAGTITYSITETAGITINGSTVSVAADAVVDATATITAKVARVDGDHTAAEVTATITVAEASQGGGDDPIYYVKATAISAGTYIMAYQSTAFNGTCTTTGTTYGQTAGITLVDDKIESNNTVDAYQVVIEASTISDGGAYVIKAGEKYLAWISGNSLTTVDSEAKNATWNISISNGNATITNGNDTSRKLQYNSSSPRFACYTSSQKLVTLYKLSE